MPLRIWMPSCAAGPLNTAACPSRTLSPVTPCARESPGKSAAAATTIQVLICLSSSPSAADRQEIRVPHALSHVELLPRPARFVLVFGAQPCRRRLCRLARLPRRRVAPAERAGDQQRGPHPLALLLAH